MSADEEHWQAFRDRPEARCTCVNPGGRVPQDPEPDCDVHGDWR